MNVSHDRSSEHIVKRDRALLGSLDASLVAVLDLLFTHFRDCTEQVILRFAARLPMGVRRLSVDSEPGLRLEVQYVVKKRPVD